MAFVTYILVAGLVMGTQSRWEMVSQGVFCFNLFLPCCDKFFYCFHRFSPEQLGIIATSAFLWSFAEVLAILFSFYICSVLAEFQTLDLIAFCGYKYVG